MGKFSQWLRHFVRISKLEDFWRHKGEQAGLRGFFMGVAANLSVIAGILVTGLTDNYFFGLIAATGSLPLLIALAIVIASKLWKRRIKSVISDDNTFNWRMYLEDEYEDQIRKIEDLGLAAREASKLKSEAFREYQSALKEYQSRLTSDSASVSVRTSSETRKVVRTVDRISPGIESAELNGLREIHGIEVPKGRRRSSSRRDE
jgi:hypothetical protein